MEAKRYPNRLGVWGFVGGGRWGVDRYLYTLHRITGLGLLAYFLLHILITSTRALGAESWNLTMGKVASPVFKALELLVFAGFVIHALNGFRLVLLELGFAVGKPEDPAFPYRSSLNTQRPLMVIVLLLAAVLIIVGGYDLFMFAH